MEKQKPDYVTALKKFKYKEFLVSEQYPELILNHPFTIQQMQIIKLFVQSILDPIALGVGKKIIILSGFRTVELNEKVSGAKDSDHLFCCAADIYSPNVESERIFSVGKRVAPYRQIIHYPKKHFVHVSCNIPGRDYKHESFTL